ncbi:MAG: hypothetical protein ABIS50_01355 [Luteolibacter sp.]|uniref:hypothetical protein n=1 Tax=Luteolibacter sp. TaxID=1962973 RepID=UPI003267919D
MTSGKLIPLLILTLAARSSALSEEAKKAGDELVTTLQEEMKNLAVGDDEEHQAGSLKQFIRQIQAGLAQDNSRVLEQTLDNFGNYEPSKKAQEGLAALKKSIKDEQQQKTQEMITELQGILDSAREKITRATEPEELDKVIVSLSRNRFNNIGESQGYDSNDAALRSLLSELGNARQFVTSWQDYLQASISGNTSQASQSLRNLASQETTLIPRSQIIARLEFEKASGDEIAKIIEGVKTLDDMKPALLKLSKMQGSNRSSGSDNAELRETIQTLSRLEKSYREFRAGLPVNVEVLCVTTPSSFETTGKMEFVELRAALLLMVLPRCLDLPEGFQPTPGENVDLFLDRAMKEANSREDTAACKRIKEVRQLIAQSNNVSGREVDNLRDYEAGKKQLAAGQYLLAVVSLQNALKSGSDLIPAAKTGEMLALIQKDHPKEYEQGMMEFLTPRPTPEYDYSRMPYRNYMPYPSRFMDGDPRGQGGTTLVLPIPAKESAPEKPATTPPAPKEEERPKAVEKPPVK